MPTIERNLYQHTPLLHFQGDHAGATLRASEVKPRLDRWIIERLGARQLATEADQVEQLSAYEIGRKLLQDNPDGERTGWLANTDEKQQCSLNYRLRFYTDKQHKNELHGKEINDRFPGYFADLGNDPLKSSDNNRRISFYEVVKMVIKTPCESLQQTIERELNAFFYANNFGTRGSRGFGSFSLAERIPEANYTFKFKVPTTNYAKLFAYLQFFHRSVRTGLNKFKVPETGGFNTTFYMKPLIFSYAAQSNIVWEKKIIKEKKGQSKFHNHGNRDDKLYLDQPVRNRPWPAWYTGNDDAPVRATVRDVFGLSAEQSWSHYQMSVAKESAKKDENNRAADPDLAIDRAPSAFTYVPVKQRNGFAVYVIARQPEEIYLNHKFDLLIDKAPRGSYAVFPGFSMREFLGTYLNREFATESIQTLGDWSEEDRADYRTIKKLSDRIMTTLIERDNQLKETLLTMYDQAAQSMAAEIRISNE